MVRIMTSDQKVTGSSPVGRTTHQWLTTRLFHLRFCV